MLSLFTLLGIVFVVLKLCKVINWNWPVVLTPFIPLVAMYFFIYSYLSLYI